MKYFSILIIALLANCSQPAKKVIETTNSIDASEKVDSIGVEIKPEEFEIPEATFRLSTETEKEHCSVYEILKRNDSTFLKVDFIQFFTNEKAIEEAKKRNEAEYDIEVNGDTSFFVYNDYYIANDTIIFKYFLISDSTKVELLGILGDSLINFNEKHEATQRLNYSPYIIQIESGIITKLSEVFTP